MKTVTNTTNHLRDALWKAESALKGCRDALIQIPEGRRGNHDTIINRAVRRADEALVAIAALKELTP